jgi:hypothetical protein
MLLVAERCNLLRTKCGNLLRTKCGNLLRTKCGNLLRTKCGNPLLANCTLFHPCDANQRGTLQQALASSPAGFALHPSYGTMAPSDPALRKDPPAGQIIGE